MRGVGSVVKRVKEARFRYGAENDYSVRSRVRVRGAGVRVWGFRVYGIGCGV